MNPLSDFKTEIKVFLIILVVAVIIAVGAILFLKTAYAPTEEISLSQPETSVWQKYKNTTYNFSVEYPANWAIGYYPAADTPETTGLIIFDKFTDGTLALPKQVSIGISADHNEKGLPLRDFLLSGGISIDYPFIYDFISPEAEASHVAERVAEMIETSFQEFEALQDGENRLFVNTGDTVFLFFIHSLEDISTKDRMVYSHVLSSFQRTNSVDTSAWQTYRNDEYGFEVKYPEAWYTPQWGGSILDLSSEKPSNVGLLGPDGITIVIEVLNSSGSTKRFSILENIEKGKTYEEGVVVYTKLDDFVVGGVPAIRFKADKSAIPYLATPPLEEEVLFRKQNDIVFHAYAVGYSDTVDRQKEFMNQILSTFRFVEG